jgi:hypothetical protein
MAKIGVFDFKMAKLAFLTKKKLDSRYKNLIIALVFEKNANLRRKLSNSAENRDHNVDPWNESNLFFMRKMKCRQLGHPRPVLRTTHCSGTCKARPKLARWRNMQKMFQ